MLETTSKGHRYETVDQMKGVHLWDRKRIFVLIMIAGFLMSVLPIRHAEAQEGPFLSDEYRGDSPSIIQNNSVSESPHPYVAGYMTFNNDPDDLEEGRATAVEATVSFSGTDKSVIQADNYLASGIVTQGPDSTFLPKIDWVYMMLLVLYGDVTDPYIQMFVLKCYERGRYGVGLPEADLIFHQTWWWPEVLTIDSEVTLTMVWNATHLNYIALIGGVEYDLTSYTPEQSESHYFMLGNCERKLWEIPLGGTCKFFQLVGAWSEYNIGTTGWFSTVTDPSFILTSDTEWRPVNFAFLVQGPDAWIDNTAKPGGAEYDDVNTFCDLNTVHFYPEEEATLETNTLLWADYPPNDPLPPSGRNFGYAGISYEYSAVTWDPDVGDEVRYEFEWDDGTRNFTDWYPRGFTALISKAWDWPLLSYHIRVRAGELNNRLC